MVEDALSTTAGDPGDLSDGNLDAGQDHASDEASGAVGSLDALFNVGADEPLTYALVARHVGPAGLALAGRGGQLYVSDGTTLTATAGGRTVFTLTVNPDGSWSFDLEDQLDHVLDSGDAGTLLQTTGGAGGRDRLLGADHRHRL